METYKEMKARHQKEIDSLPLHFAFSNEQFNEELTKMNCTADDLVSIGLGGFCLKKDKDLIFSTFERCNEEERIAMKDYDFAYSAFKYELANHEFEYTGNVEETLDSLGLEFDDLDENLKEALDNAVADYYKESEEWC